MLDKIWLQSFITAFSKICLKYLYNICRFEIFPEVSLKTIIALGRQPTQHPHNAAYTPVFQVQHPYTTALSHDPNKRNRIRRTLTNVNLANTNTRQRWSHPHHTTPYTWYNTHESHTTSEPVPYTRTHTKHTNGCYNCGEFNHHQATCRFDYKLTCGLCHQLGHKQKLCRQYSA